MAPKFALAPGWAGFSSPLRRGLSRTWLATVGPFATGHSPVDKSQSNKVGRPGRGGAQP